LDMVTHTLKELRNVPTEKIIVSVSNGHVTLKGELEWGYQRLEAKLAVQNLVGIRSVDNLITIQPKISALEVQQRIDTDFQKTGNGINKINVGVEGSKIILYGYVHSFNEQADAAAAAWSVPGVLQVECNLQIRFQDFFTSIK